MSYNIQHLNTAGRATIFTIITGVFCFAVAFIFNLGASEFNQAVAQQGDTSATTSVTVVNTPPLFTSPGAIENPASSTSTPTNSGDAMTWEARGIDANGESFYLLICSENATPTQGAPMGTEPSCTSGVQWAVSALTASNATATAATTTTETTLAGTDFALENDWYAFMCDSNGTDQSCTGTSGTAGLTLPQQGPDPNGTGPQSGSSSPFYINNPPVFSLFSTDSPSSTPDAVDPGENLNFYSTSTDGDNATTTDDADQVQLFVCNVAGFDADTRTCTGASAVQLASTTLFVDNDASSTYNVRIPTQDYVYNAFPYIIDSHGHEATSTVQGSSTIFRVDNVAPFVLSGDITLNGGANLVLDTEGNETTNFTLDFEISDNNYCVNQASSSEISGYQVSIYRATTTTGGLGESSSTTCLVNDINDYNANYCYTSARPTTTWNLSCTASTTACDSDLNNDDITQAYTCTFPLWYISDPTDGSGQYPNDFWTAQVAGIDDNGATGTAQEAASTAIELSSFLAFDLQNLSIPYGSLEPGQTTDSNAPGGLGTAGNDASSTILATGNVGIDERLSGSSMCTTFTGTSSPCQNSSTSTIDDFRQVFATSSTDTYVTASTAGRNLSSSTDQELEINVSKSTSTSTPATGVTYWGIEIPGTIQLSGDYTGLNTFIAVTGEIEDW